MDKYTKIKKIGEGSFGKALLVRHKESGKQMVVKEINMSRMQRKEREEARKETAVLAQLKHPNIVMYRESFEEVGNLYIVMDYCDGGDLYARINSQRGALFKEEEIVDWFVQCCLAIKHIHDRKILHRDIKSQNIFLTRHGIVKLGDFGIAKVLNSTVELARTCIGTPYYLSPEICENKPYNNKSDIWSLGCVLYELTTLKHAFEAGNMKNLVLKIIRGSYPPPPPRYSYELRSLINLLFKRSARDRPSINTILKKPLLQARIKKFLSESEVAEEFSHTVMHGVKLQKALPAGGRPLPPQPVMAKRPPSAGANRYNPASVYAPSVARKSRENRRSADQNVRKSDQVVRKSNSGQKKPSPAPTPTPAANANADLAKKRQELLEKERRRREEKKKEYAKQHKEIVDKQKVDRINKAREDGWKNLISSLDSSDDITEAQPSSRPESARNQAPPPAPAAGGRGGGGGGGDPYEKYHEWLEERRAGNKPPPPAPAGPMLGVAGALGWRAAPTPSPAPSPTPGPVFTPSPREDPVQAVLRGQQAAAKAGEAAERARLLEEYHQRKHAAALNKARAAGVNSPRVPPPSPKPSSGTPQARPSPRPSPRPASRENAVANSRPNSARQQHRQKQDEEYLARLKQIRLQNFNERRAVKDKIGNRPPRDDKVQDERKKKIEALRAQAEDRARKLKAELERKRRDVYEDQKRHLPRPVPAPAMTDALKAIGAAKPEPKPPSPEPCAIGMTAAMAAIGAGDVSASQQKSPLQAKKEQILARLNSKPPAEAAAKPAEKERPKWENAGGKPAAIARGERAKWEEEGEAASILSQLSLEETASQMEATNAEGIIVKSMDEDEEEGQSARRQWGIPANTVMNALSKAKLSETSGAVGTVSSNESTGNIRVSPVPSDLPTPPTTVAPGSTVTLQPATPASAGNSTVTLSAPSAAAAPVIGSTITVARGAKGTVVIKQGAGEDDEGGDARAPELAPPGQRDLDEIIIEESSSSEEDDAKDSKDSLPKPPPRTKKLEKSLKPPIATKPAIASKPSIPTKPVISDKPETVATIEDLDTEEPQTEPQAKPQAKPESPKATGSVEEKEEEEGAAESMFKKVEHDEGSKDRHDMEVQELSDEEEEQKGEVKKDEEEEEEDSDEADASKQKPAGGGSGKLKLGLTTGKFDVDVRMLRTCSEPDLSKLSRTTQNPFLAEDEDEEEEEENNEDEENEEEDEEDENLDLDALRAQMEAIGNDDSEEEGMKQEEDEEEDETSSQEEKKEAAGDKAEEKEEKQEEEEEDNSGSPIDDSDSDLETMRESMMSLLQQSDPRSDEEILSPQPQKTKKKTKKSAKKGKKTKKKKAEDEAEDTPSGAAAIARQWSETSMDDLKTLRETMASLLQPSKPAVVTAKAAASGDGEKEKTKPAAADVTDSGDAGADITLNSNTELWQEDDDADDDFFEEDDTFSRIEETREMLEKELGCDTFVEAYKKVQAIHEDEDENMQEGFQLVTNILGEEKSHLYPSILQLVMSDGAFMEDND